MVDAGIARKVDFGEGRSRFEPSYRHPRHFHLICNTCHSSSEFLSSDVESLMEEIAGARNFEASQAVVQIYGTCEQCRTGRTIPPIDGADHRAGVRARCAADGDCHRAQRPGVLHPRRAPDQGRARPHGLPEAGRRGAGAPRHAGEALRELLATDPQLESRPTFLFFKGAASGLFAEGAKQLKEGVNDQQALLIGIKCERGSHKFFKRYGERFEDSEGKQIFLEFADEERAHLDLLIREYRALCDRQKLPPPVSRVAARRAPARPARRTARRS